ncbi:hypothetical protein FHR84_002072 [Actinopolyspora biskrensis]|uniref:Uncharacterized protein n=1 Tax=Actinopolyspora biskrensis TaxID=1470178 RepID=A0A852Z8F3_9ACTN|nr:hypothetical protein [Actinopolyspora biskrensis]NYH78747.1 hypothetical protein [Actinopolyspora biskrensis]
MPDEVTKQTAFDDNLQRLTQFKTRYAPNRFRLNNIPPSSA